MSNVYLSMKKQIRLLRWVVVLLVLFGPLAAEGTSYLPMTLAEGVDRADLVVLATAQREAEAQGGELIVESVFKGQADLKRIVVPHMGLKMDPPVADGTRGVYLLARGEDDNFHFFHPVSIQTQGDLADHVEAVKRARQMLADPAPFIKKLGDTPSLDLVYALGQRLRSLQVVCPQVEALDETVLNLRPGSELAAAYPWDQEHSVILRIRFNERASPALLIESDEPDSPLFEPFSEQLRAASQWSNVKPLLPSARMILLDTRRPAKAGSMDGDEARAYLRGLIKLGMEAELAQEVFRALALARDLDAIDTVAPLLDAKIKYPNGPDAYLAVKAAQWLGWAGTERANEVLLAYLKKADLDAKGYNPVLNEVSAALYKISDPSSLPLMRELTRRQQHYGTLLIGRIGEAADFKLLLEAGNAKPTETSATQTAMFWLVKRSNKPVEDWMISPRWTSEIGQDKQAQWNTWWQANDEDFKVVRSYDAAFKP
jgi:hypothetical protein